MANSDAHQTVIDSLHTRDGAYCVDVVKTQDGFALQTCRRDEERWQVIDRPGEYDTRDTAVAIARSIISNLGI